ncbi:MAG: hypothetical protein OEW99_05220 [Gammaproteobacteria bacterium]|nr:hypothetical protein [Gammaproteobacteria bacterium]MDH5659701.1 hypothetical protein [Gammaproteobacteria bacterium]
MNLQLQAGYFSIKNPLQVLDQWLNPYHHKDSIDIRGKKMAILYSKRAEKALIKRNTLLIAELQLYFTCVVQKRVLFHDQTELDTIKANNNLEILYHTVQSDACDPVEFAEKHPVKKELQSKGAQAMRPSILKIDFKDGQWIGDFSF